MSERDQRGGQPESTDGNAPGDDGAAPAHRPKPAAGETDGRGPAKK